MQRDRFIQTCMYDTREGGQGSHDKEGGRYYVDLYREASASYIVGGGGLFTFAFTGARPQRREVAAITRKDAASMTGE